MASIPTPPDLPPILSYLVWATVVVVALLTGAWRGFLWLVERIKFVFKEEIQGDALKDVLDARLAAALESRSFRTIVQTEVAAQFQGAVGPLMTAYGDLAGQIALADGKAQAAHGRVDDLEKRIEHHLEDHP